MEARSRPNEGLGTPGSGFLEIGYHQGHCRENSPEEIVGIGCSDIDDWTSLDEDVQHNRTPLGDMHPLRGTGSVSVQSFERMAITYGQPQYFGWIHIFHMTRNLHQLRGLSFVNR